MKVTIRSEKIADYNSITNVNYEAFLGWHPDNPFVGEAVMVDMLRHNSRFEPELSLVAEAEGRIVGHAIFSPFPFALSGKELRGVVLGPIAVLPQYQKLGIGKLLIEEGHRRATEKGFAFALLCGHPDYYPKFGYRTRMFSVSGTKVNLAPVAFNDAEYTERPVNSSDVAWLIKNWDRAHARDSLALFPGETVSAWSNHGMNCRATVVLRNGQPIGYIRYVKTKPLRIKELLPSDDNMADLLAYLAWKHYGRVEGELQLALAAETVRAGVGDSESLTLTDERNALDPFMIKVLDVKNADLINYCGQVAKGALKPGIVVFPPVFDVDDGNGLSGPGFLS
jgi:putative acetyltransferase